MSEPKDARQSQAPHAEPVPDGDVDDLAQVARESLRESRFQAAREVLETLIAVQPEEAHHHTALSMALEELGQRQRALAGYTLALSLLDPEAPVDRMALVAFFQRGFLFLELGLLEQGIEDLRLVGEGGGDLAPELARLARQGLDDPAALAAAGDAGGADAELIDRIQRGDASLARVLGYDRGALVDLALMGQQMLDSGQTRGARQVFDGLQAVAPDVPAFAAKAAEVEEQMGYEQEALERYDEAAQAYSIFDDLEEQDQSPELLAVLVKRAALLIRLGDRQGAHETLVDVMNRAGVGSPLYVEAEQMLAGLSGGESS